MTLPRAAFAVVPLVLATLPALGTVGAASSAPAPTLVAAAAAPVQTCTRISRLPDGTAPAEGVDAGPASIDVSPNGRFVVFSSYANGLVPGDTNGYRDVFLYDAADGSTTMISTAGVYGDTNGDSFSPSVSDDGSRVAFVSAASNLAAGDTNGYTDAFVWRRASMSVTQETFDAAGGPTDGAVESAELSGDGRFLAYASLASTVVSRTSDTNGTTDVFRRDLATGTTVIVSKLRDGTQNDRPSRHPSISRDGGRIAFLSESSPGAGLLPRPGGRSIAVWTARTGAITRVSSTGTQKRLIERGFPSISADGRRVAYLTNARAETGANDGLQQAVVWDARSGRLIRASRTASRAADAAADGVQLSPDGRFVLVTSGSTTLARGATDGTPVPWRATLGRGAYPTAFVPLSRTPRGRPAVATGDVGGVSSDGRTIVITSRATTLIAGGDPGDTNGSDDLFRCTGVRPG